MKKITLKYGSETREVTVSAGTTVGEIVSDSTSRIMLGYGDNVKALVSGIEQPMGAVPSDGTTIVLETKLNQKAVLAS